MMAGKYPRTFTRLVSSLSTFVGQIETHSSQPLQSASANTTSGAADFARSGLAGGDGGVACMTGGNDRTGPVALHLRSE